MTMVPAPYAPVRFTVDLAIGPPPDMKVWILFIGAPPVKRSSIDCALAGCAAATNPPATTAPAITRDHMSIDLVPFRCKLTRRAIVPIAREESIHGPRHAGNKAEQCRMAAFSAPPVAPRAR